MSEVERMARLILRIEGDGRGRPNNRTRLCYYTEFSLAKRLAAKRLVRVSHGASVLQENTEEEYASITDKGREVCAALVARMDSASGPPTLNLNGLAGLLAATQEDGS